MSMRGGPPTYTPPPAHQPYIETKPLAPSTQWLEYQCRAPMPTEAAPVPLDFSVRSKSERNSPSSSGEFRAPRRHRVDVCPYPNSIDRFYSSSSYTEGSSRLLQPAYPRHHSSYVENPCIQSPFLPPRSFQSVLGTSPLVTPLGTSPLLSPQVTTTTPVRPEVSRKRKSSDRPFKNADQLLNDPVTRYYAQQGMLRSDLISVGEEGGANGDHQEEGARGCPGSSNSRSENSNPVLGSSPIDQNPGGEGDAASKSGGRRKGNPVPEDQKDEQYRMRRAKNNEAARRSRNNRKVKEDELANTAAGLRRRCDELVEETKDLNRRVDALTLDNIKLEAEVNRQRFTNKQLQAEVIRLTTLLPPYRLRNPQTY